MRSRFLFTALAVTGCSYLQGGGATPSGTVTATKSSAKVSAGRLTSASSVLRAMHDLYAGKYLKTMRFLQNNTAYSSTGQEQHTQWYEHLELPGKLRIAFLPATQRSGLVQVDDKVASFDNGIRVDFRPSVNPLLLLTADVYTAPTSTIVRGLDSLNVDTDLFRTDEWEGHPVYVIGAKAGDSTSNQMWVDAERLVLLRFIQRGKNAERPMVSDMRVKTYKDIQGYQVPTEFLVLRNGRPWWREEYANVRINDEFPAGTFDQATWKDIPIPQ
ncbi:MAG: outer membrane lipoprotein-sorting protein [Gemmatimonadota bacterium]|nr:outer membrane lipoprotein-sorting protein [Gemmatimonadota bacterium]